VKQRIKIPRNYILIFIGRLLPAYVILSLFFYFFGPLYSRMFLPVIPSPIKLIHPEYQIDSVSLDQEEKLIECNISVLGDIIGNYGFKQAKIQIKTSIHQSTLYIYPILFFSLQFAWPAINKRERLLAILLGLPFLFLAVMVDIPLTLISEMENKLVIDSIGQKFRLFMIYFFNNGGRQFVALLVVLLSIGLVHIKNTHFSTLNVGRNDPCPCGSGKKFKKCCMRYGAK